MLLPDLHVKNYRLFQDFKLERLARVNLVAGRNNVGALWDFAWVARRSPELVRVLHTAPQTSWGVQPLTARNLRDPHS